MVFVDTDVLSIFAKFQRLPLLFQVFDQESLNIARAVQNEIRRGILKGFQFSRDIMMKCLLHKNRIYAKMLTS